MGVIFLSDKKVEIIKAIIMAIAIIIAGFAVANAIDQAGLNITNALREIVFNLR
jgi:hypothetical protein